MAAEAHPVEPARLEGQSAAPWPLVTVTVLAYNRRDAVRDTLATLLRDLDYPPGQLEIIVVDNASTDGTAEMVRREFPTVNVLRMRHNIGAPALNRAFTQARGEWVLIVDDDCWIDGLALKLAVASARANGADLVSFQVRSGVEPQYLFSDAYTMGMFGFWGCAWIVTRRALEVLGGYDPDIFMWGNEVEFMMRFLNAGFRHLYLPDVIAVHMKAPSAHQGSLHPHRVQVRHWCHAAAKSLTPLDAARVIGRLLMMVVIDTMAVSPRALGTFPSALLGTLSGVRARAPVRREVSAAYRRDFISFANPLTFVRTPRERWNARHDRSRAAADAERRFDAFYSRRGRFYPREASVLEI